MVLPTRKAAIKKLNKVKKDLKLKTNGRTKGVSRKNATVVLAQGALATPKRNFGTNKVGVKGSGDMSTKALVKCLDARIPKTLGLPRPVGPYTVIRTTRLHQSSAGFIMFAPFFNDVAGKWYDWCGVEEVVYTDPVTGTNNTRPVNMPMLGLAEACEVVPAALTVQVMNPAALQDADGVFAMARVNQQMPLGNSAATLTYEEMAARVVSFYSPRLMTGGKLSLRGVKCDSYPLDMTEYANFAAVSRFTGLVTWVQSIQPAALAPIVFIQNNAIPKTLEFMVTIEWRVRFDPGNPATSSHTYHDSLPDRCWNSVISDMSAAGHGIVELSEEVATLGGLL